jgi:hypothetical protein
MKKSSLSLLALVACTMLARSQGYISLQTGNGVVYTNNGVASGPTHGAPGSYVFEALTMTQTAYNGLTAAQQTDIYNLVANPTDIELWTDTGVSGVNNGTFFSGAVKGLGGEGGSWAADWACPTDANYDTGSLNYYTIVGWSSDLGNWATVEEALNAGTLSSTATSGYSFFGQSAAAYNYAGGGPSSLAAVNLWGDSAQTGLPGSGLPSEQDALTLYAIPEPTMLALVGLGGLSLLLLRHSAAPARRRQCVICQRSAPILPEK